MNLYKIGIIGLGYVGLPIALELSKKFKVIGYDKDKNRVKNLLSGKDVNNEFSRIDLEKKIVFTDNQNFLKDCNFYIICIPTPVTKNNKPDLRLLNNACKIIGKHINYGDTIVFESTVYPGVTEEICSKIIEKTSQIPVSTKNKKGFYLGYSPERINPGDKKNTLTKITKIISSSSNKGLKKIRYVYSSIINAGLYEASSIKIAETAKIIENVQRDVNISLMNEIAIICDKLKINIYEVLKAASTKWNFLNFTPGLVGGHCVGIDPYYLINKSKKIGFNPKLISQARSTNENIINYIKNKIIQKVHNKKTILKKKKLKILLMGITFKEDCNDTRNSMAFKLSLLLKKSFDVDIYDPVAVSNIIKLKLIKKPKKKSYDIIILAVAHKCFKKIGKKKIQLYLKKNGLIFDLKNIFNEPKFETI